MSFPAEFALTYCISTHPSTAASGKPRILLAPISVEVPISDPTLASSELNDQQRRAVEHRDGPLLLVAGPGSGKTRVVTHRIGHLVASGVPAGRILAITFTNKAASEMLDRTLSLLATSDPDAPAPQISTFHSFCVRVLRREIYRLTPYHSNFTIYDTTDQKAVIEEVLQHLGLDKSSCPPGQCQSQISRWKNELLGPEDAEEQAQNYHDMQLASIYGEYQLRLAARNALDFDDLLVLTLRLLAEHPDVLERRQRFHRYIMVDEFQDTNQPQYHIARLLAAQHRNLCITGDPDQSIYSWRGASPSNFSDFRRDFPEQITVELGQNYRSTPQIVATAARLTRGFGEQRHLYTENPDGEPVRVRAYLDEKGEAKAIAEQIAEWHGDGCALRDMAILYRVNSLSRSLEEQFLKRGIPYSVVGTVAFYQRKEVKDILAYLRAAVAPRDETAFRRVVNIPPRGIGKVGLEKFEAAARAQDVTLGEALEDDAILESLGRARKGFIAFREILRELRLGRDRHLANQVEEAISLSRYLAYLDKSEPESADDRRQNLNELVSAASDTVEALELANHQAITNEEEPPDPLLSFLERIALISDVDRWDGDADRVTLLTLHAAKGLEFDRVFIAGVEENLIPHVRHHEEGNEDEERRLLYVGITRARTHAVLTYTQLRRTYREREPRLVSRFVGEIEGPEVEHEERARGGLWGTLSHLRGDVETGYDPHASEFESDVVYDDSGDDELQPGVWLDHDAFGRGVVTSVSGRGVSRRMRIRFDEIGERQMLVSATQFRIIGNPYED